jgi:hypothetical protein
MKRSLVRFSVAVAGVGLAVGAAGLPANAARAPHTFSAVVPKVHPDIPSEFIAGFTNEAPGSGLIESITLPNLTCRAGSTDAMAVGMGNEAVDDPDPVVLAVVYVICDQGVLSYQTGVLVPGSEKRGNAQVGDVLAFSIDYKKHKKVVASVVDKTDAAGSVSAKGKATKAGLHFGEFPVFTGGTLDPIPTFTTFRLVKAFAAGAPLLGATAIRVQRVNDGQTKIDVTDTIRMPPNQGSFSIVFDAN